MLELKIPKEYLLTLKQVKEKNLQYLTVVNLARVDYQIKSKSLPPKTEIQFTDLRGFEDSYTKEEFNNTSALQSYSGIPYAEIIISKVKISDNSPELMVQISPHCLPQQIRGRHGNQLIKIPAECILGNLDFLSYYHSGLIGIFNPDYLLELYNDPIARALVYQNQHPNGRWSKLPDWLHTSKVFWYDGTQFQVLENHIDIKGYTWIPDRRVRQPWEDPSPLQEKIDNRSTICFRLKFILDENTPRSLIELLQYFLYDKSHLEILSDNDVYIKELERDKNLFLTDIDTLVKVIPNWFGYLYQIHQTDITHISEDSFRRNNKWLFSSTIIFSKSLDYHTFIKNLKHYLALWIANNEAHIQVVTE
jgi:hypothetical protein